MSEDIAEIEKEIETELSRISVSSCEADDPDTEVADEALSDSEAISEDLPESVLSYLNFIKSRSQDAERLIFQDLEDEETASNVCGVASCYASDYLSELASEDNEDPEQFKERVLLEIESEGLQIATAPSCNGNDNEVTDNHFLTAGVGMSISLTHREVEEKSRQEFEQWKKRQKELEDEKKEKWKAEREAQARQNEEEHARRVQRQEELEAERIKLELLRKKHQASIEEELQKEKKAWRDKMMQHEEVIMKLQLQMEEGKKALEEKKAKERQHLAEQQRTAAVKIQATFRSFLVHKKYAPILKEWKDEIKKKQKMLEEIEKEMKEKEEKLRRRMEENWQQKAELKQKQEEFERQEHLDQVRRGEEYEKKKESLRPEREKQLQIREEQRKLGEKSGEAVVSKREENNQENTKEDELIESPKAIEQKKELNMQAEEQREKQAEMMDETNSWRLPAGRNLTPTPKEPDSEKKEHASQVNAENIYTNSVTHVEENYLQTKDFNKAPNSPASKDEAVNFGASDLAVSKANNMCSSPPNTQPDASCSEVTDQFSQSETRKSAVFLVEDANEEVRETWDVTQDVVECSSRLILPDIEKKRINWMNTCKSWSKIQEENQSKQVTRKKQPRKRSGHKMPPLSTQKIIHSGPWSTLQQVTTLTLEDLPACSLSTLSQCSSLQVLTLRRCGLVALEGLSNCKDLKYINVEENHIQIINCDHLENLCVLILNKNHLTSVYGLDDCIKLQNLELSYNRITHIGGLEALKNLQQLILDHNQLISTKGLCEAPTLIHLDCSFNLLTQVEGIENCGLLQILKLQGNNLQELPRLENHVLLRELYLDDNSISAVRMLSLYWLPLLQILLLSQNRLTELVPLNSLMSLEKLDIENNCLADLKGVITWLRGCHKLKELSLRGNPLLQERSWRSSLCEVLPNLQFLDGEILNSHTLPTTETTEGSESRAFQELCRVQIEETVQLKEQAAELGLASSVGSAEGQCWYLNQLMRLSVKHRYEHEHGERSITDRDGPEALQNHLKQTSTGCLQENNLFIMGVTENKQVSLDPSERWITAGRIQATSINSSIPVHQKENKEDQRVKQKSTESCINYSGESKGNNNLSAQLTVQQSVVAARNTGRDLQDFESDTERDLQDFESDAERLPMAASMTQSLWRQYQAKRKTDSGKTENPWFMEALRRKHEAATLIQAFWKGCLLRKKLARALAAVKSDEVEDDYEEIEVDEFTFSETALEKEWLTPGPTRFPLKTLPLSNQLLWPKKYSGPSNCSEHSNSLPLSPQRLNRPHSRQNIHFHSRSEEATISQLSDWKENKKSSFITEKEEQISEEWGFKEISTAQLMLKRAQKMKPKRHSNKNSNPAVRLALFRNSENKYLPVKPPRKTQPINVGYFEGEKEEFSQLDITLEEKLQRRNDFTYQWLHTQLLDYETTSSKDVKSSRFLPELDPAIRDSRQVQLVASPVSREDTDLDLVSMASGSALTENREKNKQPHRHSARSSNKNISTPENSGLGPPRKERISFRDHPVQLSGGWGAGKKKGKSVKKY
ncbi:leucine-rich repeat and IQ domain-containing protein 1 [Dryobates pubescens]|uniref:leucine-rich repeat and IQ domain-containing protein 1 n=1 Tax=Dryobates pubescens TaxID=118200 RepID=UPI0023BA11EF|nr:leucine-rich repeat and IQ domain-containing protein 1 [Dryobates pubescens]